MIWLAMAVAAAIVTLIALAPWWRGGAVAVLRRNANVAAYRQRLAEIEQEVKAGDADPAATDALRDELSRRLLAEDRPDTPEPTRGSRLVPAAIALLLPLAAGVWYWVGSSWKAQDLIASAPGEPDHAADALVEKLAQRLAEQPEDGPGWALLGRSYVSMQRYADAARALGEANRVTDGSDPNLLVDEGEALAMSRDRDLIGRPAQLFARALSIEPDNAKALWFSGLAAAQEENYPAALQNWRRLRALEGLPPVLAQSLDERLAALSDMTGAPTPAAAEEPAAPAPLQVRVRIAMAPEIAARAPASSTLFVFAKAAEGPPMPLAVQRLPGAKLPLEIVLDDTMAMQPQLKLSQFERWKITARLSQGGTAQAQSGDVQGEKLVSRADAATPVDVVIDTVVP